MRPLTHADLDLDQNRAKSDRVSNKSDVSPCFCRFIARLSARLIARRRSAILAVEYLYQK
jgi:hypothetical protein